MGISGCILAKNEQGSIGVCIKQMMRFVDEVIVVDNGSGDGTAEIAKNLGCTLVREENLRGDLARNRYLEAASQDWVLVLDVDEILDDGSIGKIKSLVQGTSRELMDFTLPRYEYLGRGKWATIGILRLFRNHPAIRYNDYPIHNSPGPSIRALGGRIEKADIPIHHFDILIPGRTSKKRTLYQRRLIEQIEKIGDSPYRYLLYNFLGVEYTAVGQYAQAEMLYLKTLNDCRGNPNVRGYYDLAVLYLAQNALLALDVKAAKVYAASLLDSSLADRALVVLAEIALMENDREVAGQLCARSLAINPNQASQHINLASLSGNAQERCDHMNKAAAINPLLWEERIYGAGETPNIFSHQTVFLSSVTSVSALMELADSRRA